MKFGTAGVPNRSKGRSTLDGIKTVREIGLDAMEVQFVRGVKMSSSMARRVKDVADEFNVILSVHAPYYINLNSEGSKLRDSLERLKKAVEIGSVFANNVVFHPGYYMKCSRESTYKRILENLKSIVDLAEEKGVILRPETTGKPTQFGDLEETIEICRELGILPCIDFAHIHARYRMYNSYKEFCEILEYLEKGLGSYSLKRMHVHVSGIDYGLRGEKRHLNLKESDLKYVELVKALKDFEVEGVVIVESPNLEEDAMMLKDLWNFL